MTNATFRKECVEIHARLNEMQTEDEIAAQINASAIIIRTRTDAGFQNKQKNVPIVCNVHERLASAM